MARTQMSKPEVRLRPQFRSSSIEIVTGGLLGLGRNEDGGRSSSTPLRIRLRRAPPAHGMPRRSCSFLTARSFALTVFPARRPANDEAHAKRMSSPAGSAWEGLIPRPWQNERNSCRRLASFFWVLTFTAASCVALILSKRAVGILDDLNPVSQLGGDQRVLLLYPELLEIRADASGGL